MHRIDEDISEQLCISRLPSRGYGSMFASSTAATIASGTRLARLSCTEILQQHLPGSVVDTATIATTMTGKYADGVPLYRMGAVLARSGIDLCRGTLGHWMIDTSQRHLHYLVDVMHRALLAQPLIHGDETTIQVLHEEGKSVAVFCQEQGIATQTFYWWRNRLARQEAGAVPRLAAAVPFLDLGAMPAVTQGGESLSIRLDLPGGITLTIERS